MENNELSIQILTKYLETRAQFHMFFVADFLKNEANFIENKVSKKMMPKSHKISIFRPIWPPKPLPKPFQNPKKNDEKSKLTTKAKKWGEMKAKSGQSAKNVPPREVRRLGSVAWRAPVGGVGEGTNIYLIFIYIIILSSYMLY